MSDKLVTVVATSLLSSLSNLLNDAITSTVSGSDLGEGVSSGDLGNDVSSGDLGEDDPFTVSQTKQVIMYFQLYYQEHIVQRLQRKAILV